jgi:hypothetical protein
MSSEQLEQRYLQAVKRYQAARSSNDIQLTLDELESILGDRDALDEKRRRTGLLIRANCLERLGRASEAEQRLLSLLEEVNRDESELMPGFSVSIRLCLAGIQRQTGRGLQAIPFFLSALEYFHEHNQWHSECNVRFAMAEIYQEHQQAELARENLKAAQVILEQQAPSEQLFDLLFGLGHAYYLLGDMGPAIQFQEKALILARRFKDPETEDYLLQNLAEFTFRSQDFPRALHYASNRLQFAYAQNDPEQIVRYLAYLGSSQCETGQSNRALNTFQKLIDYPIRPGEPGSLAFGTAMLGKAQVFTDLKKYDEAQEALQVAERYLGKSQDIVQRIRAQIERELQAPVWLDCTHRLLQIALAGSSKDTTHDNPQPDVNLQTTEILTDLISEEERANFWRIHNDLQKDMFRTKYSESRASGTPAEMQMPMKIEYTDDVEDFEVKWAAFKREIAKRQQKEQLQQTWDRIKPRYQYKENLRLEKDLIGFLDYLRVLAKISRAYAEIEDRKMLLRVALHTADFLETETNDPFIMVFLWTFRAELLLAAYGVCQSSTKELITVELKRCLQQVEKAFAILKAGARPEAARFIWKDWYEIAALIPGKEAYARILDLARDMYDSLDLADQFRFAVAEGELGQHGRAVAMIKKINQDFRDRNPNTRLSWSADFQRAFAINLVRSLAPDYESCVKHYGPFAPYIYHEVRLWSPELFSAGPEIEAAFQASPPVLGFADGNLVVVKNIPAFDTTSILQHELEHLSLRSGQQLRTEDGRWLLVKRDIPTASALTYHMFTHMEESSLGKEFLEQIQPFVLLGQQQAEGRMEETSQWINNMLDYYDALGTQETPSSYPCAAILLGMAYCLLGKDEIEMTDSYFRHLAVMDHEAALAYGRRKAHLYL